MRRHFSKRKLFPVGSVPACMRSYIRYILVIDNRSNLLDTSYCQQVKLNMSLTCVGSSHRIKLVRTESTAMLGVDKTIINHSENHC